MLILVVLANVTVWFFLAVLAPALYLQHAKDLSKTEAFSRAVIFPGLYLIIFALSDSYLFSPWPTRAASFLAHASSVLLVTATAGSIIRLIALNVLRGHEPLHLESARNHLGPEITKSLVSGGALGLPALVGGTIAVLLDSLLPSDNWRLAVGVFAIIVCIGVGLWIVISLARQEAAQNGSRRSG